MLSKLKKSMEKFNKKFVEFGEKVSPYVKRVPVFFIVLSIFMSFMWAFLYLIYVLGDENGKFSNDPGSILKVIPVLLPYWIVILLVNSLYLFKYKELRKYFDEYK